MTSASGSSTARATHFGYEIDVERRVVVMTCRGFWTRVQLTAALHRLWADPRYARSFDGLVDLRGAVLEVGIEDLHVLADYVLGHAAASHGRWAAVVVSPFTTAYAMLYRQSMMQRHPFEVFSTWEAACVYLGRALAPVEALRPLSGDAAPAGQI